MISGDVIRTVFFEIDILSFCCGLASDNGFISNLMQIIMPVQQI